MRKTLLFTSRVGILIVGMLLLGVLPSSAQNTTTAPAAPPQRAQIVPAQTRDPIDARVQEAMRERDAIIRNLLERVQELENRLNGTNGVLATGSTPARQAAAPAAARVNAVAEKFASNAEERRASDALDQALLVRGGLLLPNGTVEVDNTASYFSASSDHVTVNGFALLPVLVVGDITSKRLRRDFLIHCLTTRLGLPGRLQMDLTVPYGYVLNRTVDAHNKQTSTRQFGLGDIQAGVTRQLTIERG